MNACPIHSIVRYLEISDGNMQEGSFRCDANVSVRPDVHAGDDHGGKGKKNKGGSGGGGSNSNNNAIFSSV